MTTSRVPAGVPTGGQFSTSSRGEAGVSLQDAPSETVLSEQDVWDQIYATDQSGRPCDIVLPDGRTVAVNHTTFFDHNEHGGIEGRKGAYTIRVDGAVVDEFHYSRAGSTLEDTRWRAASRVAALAVPEPSAADTPPDATTSADGRNIPSREHAAGMLEGILSQRRLQGLTGPHPYDNLDLDNPTDRKIIGSVYAMMAKEAMGR